MRNPRIHINEKSLKMRVVFVSKLDICAHGIHYSNTALRMFAARIFIIFPNTSQMLARGRMVV